MVAKSEIFFVRSLADRKVRREHGLFVVEGRKMVAEALASGWNVRNVYDDPRDVERMSSLKTPQGVLAVVETQPVAADSGGLVLALDGVQDPGNLGTIMRTADWFGVRRIVCSPECADCFNPKAVQASMGAVFRVSVEYGQLTFPADVPVYGTFMEGENIYDVALDRSAVVVLGSEGRGISPETAARVTRRLTIPSFSPRAESLNVAAAAAIVCSEFTRRG